MAAVAAVLLAASVPLVLIQRGQLTSSIDRGLEQRADDLGDLVATLDPIPAFVAGSQEEGFAQLVVGGEVVASTRNLDGDPPLPIEYELGATGTVRTVEGLELDDDVFRVLSRTVATSHGPAVLHVGTTFDVVNEATGTLVGILGVLVPVVVTLVAAIVWWLVGRTLRPVEDIRSEVDGIDSGDLHRRVPVPRHDDEIGRLARTMNRMLERIEASVDRQRRFVADASHELRSPLTRLRTEIDVSLAGESFDRRSLESLQEEVEATQRLVDDLLHLARSDASSATIHAQLVDLDDIVLRESEAARADGRIDVDVSGVSAVEVMGDRGQLTRAIRNVSDNARRHAASRVSFTLGERDGMAVLTITDDGPGIPPDQAAIVFERFGRLDDSRSRTTGGTGLGLAIAREIVERHAGTVELDTTHHPGASFVLTLPLA
jgi:signal transduction histidine kinase